jgi:hypothetical protein
MAKTPRGAVPPTTGGYSGIATATAPRPAVAKPQTTTTTKAGAPTYEQIAQRAREIWTKKGCLPGQDEQNWLEAERQLKAEMAR